MILRLLDPILNLHGLEAYALVGAFVFAEASILIGFIFPGETAVILGGVVASRGHINIVVLIIVVVVFIIGNAAVTDALEHALWCWARRVGRTLGGRNRSSGA